VNRGFTQKIFSWVDKRGTRKYVNSGSISTCDKIRELCQDKKMGDISRKFQRRFKIFDGCRILKKDVEIQLSIDYSTRFLQMIECKVCGEVFERNTIHN
jgi:hypothetical protein